MRFLVELFLNKTHGFDLGNLEIVHFFVSSLGNGPMDSFSEITIVCFGLVQENNDALSEIILSHGDVCAPYTHPIYPMVAKLAHLTSAQIR